MGLDVFVEHIGQNRHLRNLVHLSMSLALLVPIPLQHLCMDGDVSAIATAIHIVAGSLVGAKPCTV